MLQTCKKQGKWWFPLSLLIILTPWMSWLDMHISHYFYREGHFSQNPFLFFLYEYGELFGFIVGGLACFVFFASYFYKKWQIYHKAALLFGLTLVVGAGLITNTLCKGYLGRPRPKQLIEFGGSLIYRPFWHPNLDPSRSPQKSLPSGHVAMGFSYLALVIAGRRCSLNFLTFTGFFLTLFWGGGLMIARLAQGGHFFSDVILAACIMWWTVCLLDSIFCALQLYSNLKHQKTKPLI